MSESVKLALHKQKAERQAAQAAANPSLQAGDNTMQHLGSTSQLSKTHSCSTQSAENFQPPCILPQLAKTHHAKDDAKMLAPTTELCEADYPAEESGREHAQKAETGIKPLPTWAPASLLTAQATHRTSAKTQQMAHTSNPNLNSLHQLPIRQLGTPDASDAGLSSAPSGNQGASSLQQQRPEQRTISRASIDTRPQLWQVMLGNAVITAGGPVKHSNAALQRCFVKHHDKMLSLQEAKECFVAWVKFCLHLKGV